MLSFVVSRQGGERPIRCYLVTVAIALAAVGMGAIFVPVAAGPTDGTLTFSDVFLRQGIYTSDADLSNRTRVLDSPHPFRPKWLPDGSKISFLMHFKDAERLEIMDPDGSNRQILVSRSELPARLKFIKTYAWSPDATRVALCLTTKSYSVTKSYMVDADGSNRALLSDNSCVASWSAQDTILADRDSRVLILMDPDGGNRTRIEPGMRVADPELSPAGTRIAFMCGKLVHADICTIGVDGSSLSHLTHSQRIDWSPSWSPDGSRIIWAPTTNSKYQSADLMRMWSDGTHKVRLTDTPHIDEYEPDWKA